MKKHYLWLAALALGVTACTEDALTPEAPEQNQPEQTTPEETTTAVTLNHAKLASFTSSQSRVTVAPQSRAALPGSLTLFAEIDNLSKEDGRITGFVKEENGRYLSATCVYFNEATGKYYVTYHMQGNNYNTLQNDETSGFVETFTLDQDGTPQVENIFMAENPSELDFDFNHMMFDNTASDTYYRGTDKKDRIIAVGHLSKPGKGNTQAIIAELNLDGEPSINYSVVYTNEKILDADGKSLGKADAKDVNCVIRIYDWYYLATRKGIASLNAIRDSLFTPVLAADGSNYFITTPGSAKFVYNNPGQISQFSALYLTNNTPDGGLTYDSSSPAKVANFLVHGKYGDLGHQTGTVEVINNFDITTYDDQVDLPAEISPMDGKNAFTILDSQYYYSLGKGGMYADNNYSSWKTDIIKFGDIENGAGRPVNCVFVDGAGDNTGGEYHNGYIYVANGRCLTILDRATLETVAEYSADINEEASANYIHVYNGEKNMDERRTERIITVAYGQAGVKVFKFIPPTKW